MLLRPSQLWVWGKRVCCPTASCPTARSCKKRLSFAACPAAAGSNQHKAGRQARYRLADLPRLPYIVNLGVTTELPTDHKALPMMLLGLLFHSRGLVKTSAVQSARRSSLSYATAGKKIETRLMGLSVLMELVAGEGRRTTH
jgi:hypothetical protein